MASINTMANNNNTNAMHNKIESLWVMGGASVLKSRNTHDIVAYSCYCEECKKKSVSGDGGIAFYTAEDLLAHRKMKAFECPNGCGFHICEEFGSIVRHLDAYHKEVIAKLEKEGLDLSIKKRVWIYPDYENNTYTLTKPMPVLEASPLENAGIILSMTPPKRVAATPSPVPPEVQAPKGKSKGRKYVPFNKHATSAAESTTKKDDTSVQRATVSGPPKTWNKTARSDVSFSQVMSEQKKLAEAEAIATASAEYVKPVHYAQTDMRKETQCKYGKGCVKRDRPFACALNHDGKGDIIPRGTELTEAILCPYERPPFQRCGDGRCTKVHLEHRVDFIEQKKQQMFNADPKEKLSYGAVAGSLKQGTATAVITTSAEGTTIVMSKEDAMAVAIALKELEDAEIAEEESWNAPRGSLFSSQSPDTPQSTSASEVEDEDDDDLSNPAIFAARFSHTRSE